MNSAFVVVALFVILSTGSISLPAFAQIDNSDDAPISVMTDKESYAPGSVVVVSGTVRDKLGDIPVSLQLKAPNGNILQVAQLDVADDKTFSKEIKLNPNKSYPEYLVLVSYGGLNRAAETTFTTGGSSETSTTTPAPARDTTIPVPGTDFNLSYEITGGSVDSIAPDTESNSLIISITATSDGVLTITLPRALIDSAGDGVLGGQFIVIVDGEEQNAEETSTTSTSRTLRIPFYAISTEIEIIGTMVVPEFGAIAVVILAVAIVSIVALTARSRLAIMPRI